MADKYNVINEKRWLRTDDGGTLKEPLEEEPSVRKKSASPIHGSTMSVIISSFKTLVGGDKSKQEVLKSGNSKSSSLPLYDMIKYMFKNPYLIESPKLLRRTQKCFAGEKAFKYLADIKPLKAFHFALNLGAMILYNRVRSPISGEGRWRYSASKVKNGKFIIIDGFANPVQVPLGVKDKDNNTRMLSISLF